jgi:hypothetical protein
MAKSETVVQVDLVSGESRRTCWVDPRPRLLGKEITLKDSDEPDRRWTVTRVGGEALRSSLKTDWHNNI